MLSTEEYLEKLKKESYFWPFQATPLGDAWDRGMYGTQELRNKQRELLSYFPQKVHDEVQNARIGIVYDKYVNNFATSSPNGEAVVCISWLLYLLHLTVNQAMKDTLVKFIDFLKEKGEFKKNRTFYAPINQEQQ